MKLNSIQARSEKQSKLDSFRDEWLNNPENKNDSIVVHLGTWVVTTYGVECLSDAELNPQYYVIPNDLLDEQDWPLHLAEKSWCEMWDFLRAFYYARHLRSPEQYPSLETLGMRREKTKP